MQITLSEYLKNPYGKGSSFANVSKQLEDLTTQFHELDTQFLIKIYKHGDLAILHVVVPSQHREDVTYDVVYEVDLSKATTEDVTIDRIPLRVFSNCPSFIFTYANAFRRYNLLCRWLENKYRADVRKHEASVKNQYGIIGLERSLYLSMLYIKQHNYNVISVIDSNATKVTAYTQVALKVRTQDQVMDNYKSQLKKEVEKPPTQKETTTKPSEQSLNELGRLHNDKHAVRATPTTKKVGSSKKVGVSHKVKTMKVVKKI